MDDDMKSEQFHPNWIDYVFIGIRLLWLLLWVLIFTNNEEFNQTLVPLFVLLLWLLLSYLLPQFFLLHVDHSYQVYYVLEFLLTGSLYIYLLLFVGSDSSLLLIPLISLGFYYSHRFLWWSISLLLMMIPVMGLVLHSEPLIILFTHLLNNMIALGIGFTFNRMDYLFKKNQKQYSLINEQKIVLEQYAKQVESLTLLEERNRMASELHDTVGHTFTSVIVGIDGIISNLKRSDTERALNKLHVLRNSTRKGLEEIRQNIHMNNDFVNDESIVYKLSVLADDFAKNTGTKIDFKHIGSIQEVGYHAQYTLMRCLQEALTNGKRHGNAQNITITFAFESEGVVLTIKDDGDGTEEFQFGFGLNSMRQRLLTLNGNLHITASSGFGMELTCSIPYQGGYTHEQNKVTHSR
ncbi:sensor histidine kinase [Lysinibacillus sp. BW-2-10]|uniref:sensor histidine kinase n=1 Tax=Lysinibacillus sp. BW-2-10 TaxID=2590030 RepID=UPI00117C9B56|nr:sensor histidine kinase [Lysinibacillus sp. BW-2-10]TSI11079.1 sensor histidine kinase [Lysinibacillus sp. BW-2-10]